MEVTTNSFSKEVLESNIPVVVDFWAPWCGPCRSQTPILQNFATEMGDKVKVCKVNTDDEPALAAQYNIMSIPTIIVFKNGQIANRAVGVQSILNLKKMTEL